MIGLSESNNGSKNGAWTPIILEQLSKIQFGEHNIMVYDSLNVFREVYSSYAKNRLVANNEIVIILTYLETVKSVEYYLKEAGIDADKYATEGSLVIVDSVKQFFGTGVDFLQYLKVVDRNTKEMGKSGISVIADLGAFDLLGRVDELLKYVTSIPPVSPEIKCSSLLCNYHAKSFGRLAQDVKDKILGQHHRKFRAELAPES